MLGSFLCNILMFSVCFLVWSLVVVCCWFFVVLKTCIAVKKRIGVCFVPFSNME